MKRPPMKKGVLKRIIKMLFKGYPWQMAIVCVCIVLVSFSSTIAGIFMSEFIKNIESALKHEITAEQAFSKVTSLVLIMLCIYAVGWICNFTYTRIMAIVTQDFLDKLRRQMFDKMQSFPIRYFDTNAHGDIMSHYTNDVDTIRELISVTIPHLIQAALIVGFLIGNMIYLSVWMAFVVAGASVAMIVVAKAVGGRSAKGFVKMQRSIAKTEGFVEEMMEGVELADRAKVITILDRYQAIKTAMLLARPKDIVLIAGKGHENYQEINGTRIHFDDKEVVRETMV
jgi:ATP-binding cassette subfamily B protein